MKKIGVVMAKGGAGKSTLVRHLAVAAHQEDFATVVLDTDPQGTLQDWAERRNGQEPHVVTEYSTNPDRIAKAFERIEVAGADLLIVDTQGQHSPIATNVAMRCDLVLIPMKPTPEDLKAVPATIDMLRLHKISHHVVLSQCPWNTPRPKAEAYSLLNKLKVPVWMGAIHLKDAIPSSWIAGETVLELEGLSRAEEKSVEEFRSLWTWVRRELGLKVSRLAAAQPGEMVRA